MQASGCHSDCFGAPAACPAGASASIFSSATGAPVGTPSAACSGRGVCLSATATCVCNSGYSGAACQRCAAGFLLVGVLPPLSVMEVCCVRAVCAFVRLLLKQLLDVFC
jgi:EGF-like domain